MQKSHIYILIILAVGFFLAFQWQINKWQINKWQININKMDRKLTCIYNLVNTLPSFVVPELRADQVALQKQIEFVELSCDKGYIFSGFPK